MGRENYSSGKGQQKKILFPLKLKISYPNHARLYDFTYKKKGNKVGKNHITFSVESLSLIIF